MTCIPADRLLQTLRTQVPGITDDMLNIQLYNTLDEFFRKTNAWRYEVDINMVDGVLEYSFGVPVDATVVRMLSITHQGQQVVSTAQGRAQTSVGRLTGSEVFPDGDVEVDPVETDLVDGLFTYAIYRPDYIALTGLPDAEARKQPLQAVLALTVGGRCLECECGDWPLEDWMWDTYFQAFLDGALWRLYGIPAKPWSSTTLAQYHGRRFRNAMAYHKQEAQRGFTHGVQTWKFPGAWTR